MSLGERLLETRHVLYARLGVGTETSRATRYWASLRNYHESNDEDPQALERSRFIADELVSAFRIRSLLEVGANTGRNLGVVKRAHTSVRVKGIDVNERALRRGRELYPDVEFALQDANEWTEPAGGWDAVLTMSVLDHVPDEAVVTLARNMAECARLVICFELWDGADAERGLYKYSRDTRRLFENLGVRTRRWELAPGQYDVEHSVLWLYVGETSAQA